MQLRRIAHRDSRSGWASALDEQDLASLAELLEIEPPQRPPLPDAPKPPAAEPWLARLEALARESRPEARRTLGVRSERSARAVAWSDRAPASWALEQDLVYLRRQRDDGSVFVRAYAARGPDDAGLEPWLAAAEAEWAEDPAHAGLAPAVLPAIVAAGGGLVVLHELLGHPLEADNRLRGLSALAGLEGRALTDPTLTVIDSPAPAHGPGALELDDEGTPGVPVTLVAEGVLTGTLTDRATAWTLGVQSSGNGRRASFRHAPAPRLRNLVIQPGPRSFEALLGELDEGLYVERLGECMIHPSGRATLWVETARRVRAGRLAERLRGFRISGTLPGWLGALDGVGDDVETYREPVLCDKEGVVLTGLCGPSLRFAQVEAW